MKTILLADINNFGKKGDVKEVAEGYARNFLFPKKLAQSATDAAIKKAAENREKEKQMRQEAQEKMKKLAAILKEKELVVKSKEKEGKLFGSVSKKDIVDALKAEKIDTIKEDNIILEGPIKRTGSYDIKIKLSGEVQGSVKLTIQGT